MTVTFERETRLLAPIETAFDLSLSIDAHVESMRSSGERAVGGTVAGIIGMGEFVTWRARHFGITWTMTSQIVAWDRPYSFTDEQVRGPFARFHHEHRFEARGSETLMFDRVVFAAPLGIVGRLVERMVLARYLAHLIDVRNEFLVTSVAQGAS